MKRRTRNFQEEFAAFRAPAEDLGPDWIAVDAAHPPDDQTRLCRWGASIAFAARILGTWFAIPGRMLLDPPSHYFRQRLTLKLTGGMAA